MDLENSAEMRRALGRLNGGLAVAFAADEGYLVGVDAEEARSIERLRDLTQTSAAHALRVLLPGGQAWRRWVPELPAEAERLLARYPHGGLALSLPPPGRFAEALAAGASSIEFSSPRHPVAAALVRLFGRPLAVVQVDATHDSGGSDVSVRFAMPREPDAILRGPVSVAPVRNTVVSFPGGRAVLQREGAVSRRELEDVLGRALQLEEPR